MTGSPDLNLQLFLAARDGDTRSVAELLAYGVSPNLREESSGGTPLLLAAYRCDVVLVRLLLEYGADPDVSGPGGATPLHAAAYLGSEAIVRELLAAGAGPEPRNETGHTPLHDAAGEGHAEIVRLLLEADVNIDVVSHPLKETPLHRAAYDGRQEVAEILVNRGALLHPKTRDGFTPLLLAASQEHLSIVRLLLDARRGSRGVEAPNKTATLDTAEARELCRRAAALRLEWQDENRRAEAQDLFRRAVQQFPNHWEGHFGLGELLHVKAHSTKSKSRDLIDEMIHELRRGAELAPHQVEPILRLARVIAEFDVASAEPLYRSAMDTTFPDGPTLYPERWQADDHWAIAIYAADANSGEGLSLEAFCRAIDFDPYYYGGFIMPADERAQAIWRMALLIKPGGKPKRSKSHLDSKLEKALREARASFDEMMKSHNQSLQLAERYQKTGLLSDLEEALDLARKAAQLAPENPQVLCNMGFLLYLLYERSGRPADLSASIASWEKAATRAESEKERVSNLDNLASVWHTLYMSTGDLDHLERSITAAKEVIEATPRTFPRFPAYVSNMGLKLLERYKRTGAIEDLETMIQICEDTLNDLLPGSPYRATFLYNLAIALRNRSLHSSEISDLSLAIEYFEEARTLTPKESLDYLIRCHGLASGLLNRYSRTNSTNDLEKAIDLLEVVVQRTDPDSPLFPLRLSNLSQALGLRYEASGHEPDLLCSLAQCEQLCQITSPHSPMFSSYLHQLGSVLELKWQRSQSADDWRQAIDALRRAAQSGRDAAVQTAMIAAGLWLSLAMKQEEWSEAQNAYEHAWEASEKLVRLQLLRRDKESWLEHTQGLAAFAAFVFAKTGRLSEAAEALERGQARLLSESLAKDRTALERLAATGHADLLARYQGAIERIRQFSDQEVPSPEIRSQLAQAHAEVEQILEKIRSLEGFEDFLRPTAFAEIRSAAASKPLIYIAATPAGGLALVIGTGSAGLISNVWLPELRTDSLALALWGSKSSAQRGFLGAQRAWQASREVDELEQWQSAVDRCGRWLWDAVMAPILQAVPTLCEATLIPIGTLSLLPLHTAWREDPTRPTGRIYLLDVLTVSYSPNAHTLLEARTVVERASQQRLLAIDEPKPTRTASALVNSEHEVCAVAALFTDPKIIRHQEASRENVLATLPGHDVLHFSCHGHADLANPLSSFLLMAGDQHLTLRDLLTLRLEGTRLAVLSACKTGVPGTRLPEEVIHLPSGLLQAGAGGILASLAPVPDFSTMLLISSFYSLWRRNVPDPAQALRYAQIWVRDTTNGEKVKAAEDAIRGSVRPGSPSWPSKTAERILDELRRRDPGARDFCHPFHWGAFQHVGA